MIKYDDNRNIWILETNNNSYALGVSETGLVNHIYYGEKLPYISDYPSALNESGWASFTPSEGRCMEEFMAWGSARYTEPCLKAVFNDNVRDVILKYNRFSTNGNLLEIVLKDEVYPLEVSLYYNVIEDCDIIERWAEIKK